MLRRTFLALCAAAVAPVRLLKKKPEPLKVVGRPTGGTIRCMSFSVGDGWQECSPAPMTLRYGGDASDGQLFVRGGEYPKRA